jgi:hypothetical protein
MPNGAQASSGAAPAVDGDERKSELWGLLIYITRSCSIPKATGLELDLDSWFTQEEHLGPRSRQHVCGASANMTHG